MPSDGEVELVDGVVDVLVDVRVDVRKLVAVRVLVGALVGAERGVLVGGLVGGLVRVDIHVGGRVATVATAGVGGATGTTNSAGTAHADTVAAAAVAEVHVDQTRLVDVATVATDAQAAATVSAVAANRHAAVATGATPGVGEGVGVLALVGGLHGPLVGALGVDQGRLLVLHRGLVNPRVQVEVVGQVGDELVEVDRVAHDGLLDLVGRRFRPAGPKLGAGQAHAIRVDSGTSGGRYQGCRGSEQGWVGEIPAVARGG